MVSETFVDLLFWGFLVFVSIVWVLTLLAYLSFIRSAKKCDPDFYREFLVFSRVNWSISRGKCLDDYLSRRNYEGRHANYDKKCKKYFLLLRANEFLMKVSLLIFVVKFLIFKN